MVRLHVSEGIRHRAHLSINSICHKQVLGAGEVLQTAVEIIRTWSLESKFKEPHRSEQNANESVSDTLSQWNGSFGVNFMMTNTLSGCDH